MRPEDVAEIRMEYGLEARCDRPRVTELDDRSASIDETPGKVATHPFLAAERHELRERNLLRARERVGEEHAASQREDAFMPGHVDVDGGGRAVTRPRRSRMLRVDTFLRGTLDAKAAARTVKCARVERRRDVRVRRRVA